LNALAGAPIAQASFTRPTTRDPVVYYHQSIRSDRLEPALRHCRLSHHDRDSLAQKVIVDTPDIDSNDLANREKLLAVLPLADVVLYVGSQEKYHDKIGWELFKEQRQRRAFAFVLNKWDRCVQAGAAGLRPDEDLLRDLKAEGFEKPVLFRTMAQTWLDFQTSGQRTGGNGKLDKEARPAGLAAGEQFAELLDWLEMGLTRLEIEAVKARGVGQLLEQIVKELGEVRPPDLTAAAARTRECWEKILRDEAAVCGDVLLSTLDPYQSEIEQRFSVEGQQKFRGFMGAYLRLTSKLSAAGNSWRARLTFLPKIGPEEPATTSNWSLTAFAHECNRVAGEKVLDKRSGAIVNRLLVEADRNAFPLALLNNATNATARLDWHQRYDRALIEALAEVERICTHPRGMRKVMQVTIVSLANILPEIVFLVALVRVLYSYFMLDKYVPNLFDVVLPFAVTLLSLILMQILIALLLPMRWSTVRNEFRRQLVERLERELTTAYAPIPEETAAVMMAERSQVDRLAETVGEVLKWLEERQSAASIAGLYGK